MLRKEKECIRPGILGKARYLVAATLHQKNSFFFAGAPWIAGQEQAEVNISFVSPCEPSTTLVKVSQLKNAQKLNSQSSNQTGVNYIVQ